MRAPTGWTAALSTACSEDETAMRTEDTRRLNWRRPIPHEDPGDAQLMEIIVALTSEVATLRERLDTHERLAERAGGFTPAQVDAYEPEPAAVAVRDRLRQGLIRRVFKALQDRAEREAKAARAGREPPSDG